MTTIAELTEQTVLSIWRGPAQTGRHRSDAYKYPQAVEKIVRYIRENAAEGDAVETASEVWYRFCDEQPFGDCNKRTGLIIATMILEERGIEFVRPDPEIAHYLNLFATNYPSRSEFKRWVADGVGPRAGSASGDRRSVRRE